MTIPKKSYLLLLILLIVLPLAVFLVKQRQEIRKKAATNDISVYLNSTNLAPGATTPGGVNVVAGSTAITVVAANLVYDATKITVTNFSCASGLNQSDLINTPGNMSVLCSKTPGFSNTTFSAATFTVTAGSATGDVVLSLGSSAIRDNDGNILTSNKISNTLRISSSSAGTPVFFSLGSSVISPGGNTSGVVKLIAGTTLVRTARIVVSYDPLKLNLTNFACNAQNFPNQTGLELRSGAAEIICSSSTGVSSATVDIASFTLQALAGATLGSTSLSFATTTRLTGSLSADVPASLADISVQIGQSTTPTPTAVPGNPSITSLTPACGPRGTLVTANGTNLGTTNGSVCFDGGYGCTTGANVTSWNTTQVKFTVPEPIRDAEYNRNFSVQIKMPGSGTAIPAIQTFYVSNNCAGATPTPTVVVTPTPTATVNPNAQGTLTLTPASTTVGVSPVLVEIKLNSGVKKVTSAQAIILVDPKLTVVNSGGATTAEILPGNTALSNVVVNSYASNKIIYSAGKASGGTAATTIDGTLAKFYVKTSETSGTAVLSFKTGQTPGDSLVLDEEAVNVLGVATPLTLTLGSTVTGPSFSIKLKLAGVESKPTTPANVTGVDYGHLKANVMLKTGDTVILVPTNVTLTPDASGLYTSELIALGSVPAGTYALYVKPEKHYQKRFPNTSVPTTAALDLTANAFRFGPGDLNQDGTINGVDIGIVINAINKQAGSALNASDLRADVDYNGIINGGDTSLIFETINTRFDEDH